MKQTPASNRRRSKRNGFTNPNMPASAETRISALLCVLLDFTGLPAKKQEAIFDTCVRGYMKQEKDYGASPAEFMLKQCRKVFAKSLPEFTSEGRKAQ